MDGIERFVKRYCVHFVFDDYGYKGMDYEGYEMIDYKTIKGWIKQY